MDGNGSSIKATAVMLQVAFLCTVSGAMTACAPAQPQVSKPVASITATREDRSVLLDIGRSSGYRTTPSPATVLDERGGHPDYAPVSLREEPAIISIPDEFPRIPMQFVSPDPDKHVVPEQPTAVSPPMEANAVVLPNRKTTITGARGIQGCSTGLSLNKGAFVCR